MSLSSTRQNIIAAVVAVSLLVVGYWAGTQRPLEQARNTAPAAAPKGVQKIDPKTGRTVLYWHDPMMPGQKFDKPGKSPFMDMELVPVFADEATPGGGVKVSPVMEHNLGIRYATVRKGPITSQLDLVGTTQYDERFAEVVQSRTVGYIERLYARAPLQRIQQGQPIATLFVPEWLAAQEEYLVLLRSNDPALAAAALERMRALAIPVDMIARAKRTGNAQRTLTLSAPVAGVMTELPLREGAMVSPGMTIAKINGTAKLWLMAEVPERQAHLVRAGQTVEAALPSQTVRRYHGKILEVLPGVNPTTRTIQARIELDNRDASLTPGLLMQVGLKAGSSGSALMVPTEAVIASGKGNLVLVADASGIRPVNVSVGREVGDATEVLGGLAEGQKVVASGQFLIDSEARLKGVLPKLAGPAESPAATSAPAQSETGVHMAAGRVEKITAEALTLSHGPVPSLAWPAMTMDFAKPHAQAFRELQVGQQVEFTFRANDKGGYVLDRVAVKRASP